VPRYYFDTDDGRRKSHDDQGLEYAHEAEARDAAIRALPDMAKDALPGADRETFSVSVRDDGGRYVLHASLVLVAHRLEGFEQ